MKSFYRVMLGQQSSYASECFAGGYIGADFDITDDLTGRLPDAWRDFNRIFIPIWLRANPGKSKISAGLSCGFLWTIAKGIQTGDIILSPDGAGNYRVGEVVGNYAFAAGRNLPHRRAVKWSATLIARTSMTERLRRSAGSIGTVANLSPHSAELGRLISTGSSGATAQPTVDSDEAREFAMEKHLEEFLIENWASTELGWQYDIWTEDGQLAGQQYETDTGPLDILAVSKDRSRLLVIELKQGRASDAVVGQILRYMSYVKELVAEDNQAVEGVVIALRDDPKLRRALQMTPNVRFYRYKVQFSLVQDCGR
jgi:restriction system protein